MGYLISVVGLFFYSFMQIDLGLTLSQVSVWQTAEKFFKNIGYFQRPLSSFIFIIIVLLLFAFYLLILNAVRKKEISKKFGYPMIECYQNGVLFTPEQVHELIWKKLKL